MDDDKWAREDEERPEGVRIIGAREAAEALEQGRAVRRRPDDEPRFGDRPPEPPPPEEPRPTLRFPGGRSSEGPPSASLPHWTEPPTGEVPRLRPEGPDEPGEEDMSAWSSFATQAPRWRDQPADWETPDYDVSGLADEETRVGALDESRRPVSELFSFDEPEPEPAPPESPMTRIRTGGSGHPGGSPRHEGGGGDRNLPLAVVTGVALAGVFLILLGVSPGAAMVLVTPVIVVGAAEFFASLRRVGYAPATLLGLVATTALVLAAFWRGEAAYPLVLFLFVAFGLLWYLSAEAREHVATNLGVTLLGVAWLGGLGAFAALLLKFPNGEGMLLGVVIATVAYDVGGLFVGGSTGRAPLAPNVSPNKTREGLIGGMAAAILVSVVVVGRITPWNDLADAFWLGVVVAVAAPLGDLCESMIKRDLGVKDMGSVLPGHGGLLDRFDAMLFVLPSVYYLARLLELS